MRSLLIAMTALVVCSGCKPEDTKIRGSRVIKFEGAIPTNLLFISIDTFRRDHMGLHGDKGLTPFLDSIGQESMVMMDHQQCSDWTFGSTTCTLAGRTNVERGHMPRLSGGDAQKPPVPPGTPFLATWLGTAGFFSAIVSGNGWLSSEWGNTQGYDAESKPGGNGTTVLPKGLELLRPAGKQPWFMHLHYMEPHAPYTPPQANVVGQDLLDPWPEDLRVRDTHYDWRGQYGNLSGEEQALLEAHLRLLYEAEIRTIDARLADTWTTLDRGGWLDDTLVVFWSDHGEAFWEHGFQTHAYNLTYEENDGFLWFWADNIVSGSHVEPTSAIDVVPTVLDLFGLERPDEVTGYPIGTAPDERPIFADALARRGGVQSVTQNGLKLHYNWNNGSVRVWDRRLDPTEEDDLFDPDDEEIRELWKVLKPQVQAMEKLVVDGPSPVWPDGLP